MDALDRAHIQAARRLHRRHEDRPARNLARQDHPLQVAAREQPHRGFHGRHDNVIGLFQLVGVARGGRRIQHPTAGNGRLVVSFHDDIIRDAQVGRSAHMRAVFGDISHAAPDGQGGRAVGDILAIQPHFALLAAPQPVDHLGQLDLPVARHARQAHYLAGMHLEADPSQRGQALIVLSLHILKRQHSLPALAGFLFYLEKHLAPHHQARQLLAGDASRFDPRGGDLALAQHRHPVGNRHHLLQLVADEDDGFALCHHGAQGGKQTLDLLRRQHGGRLIHDQYLCAAIEHLEDFYPLLLAHRKLPHLGARVHLHPKALAQLGDPGVVFLQAQEETRLFQAKQHILGDRLRRHQHKVLVDHADAGLDGIAWRRERDRFAFDQDSAAFLAVQASQDVHQGALAGPILTQQSMDLTLAQLEIHMVVRQYAREALDNAGHLDRAGCIHHPQFLTSRARIAKSWPWKH